MTGRVSKTAKVSETGLGKFEIGFFAQIRMMIDAFWGSSVRNRLILLAGGLLAIIIAKAYGQVQLNRWNVPFYDALSRRNMPEFLHQLGIFAVIASILLLLNVMQTWFNQMTALKMREGLARDLVDQWMAAKRALRLTREQEVHWHPVESTLRKIAQTSKRESTSGIVQRVKAKVSGYASHASAYQQVSSVAGPLIASLDEKQRQDGMRIIREFGFNGQ